MLQWKIGCSGFYYAEWQGMFYPESLPQRKWFEHYCEYFNTVELNGTFYRFPKLHSLKSWYNRSPENFHFCVKAPRLLTHFKRFADIQGPITDFYECVAEGLREKMSAALFQFPATFQYDEEKLNSIVSLLNKSFVNVLEFRHPSWWQQSVFDTLTKAGVTISGMSHPSLPSDVIKTSSTIYYRFHGVPRLYHSSYDMEVLQSVADKIATFEDVDQVCLYFNNTASGSAIVNAKALQEYCHMHIEH